MNFKKTLTARAISRAVFALLGGAVGIVAAKTGAQDAIMYFGFALAFASVIRFAHILRLMKNAEQAKLREVAEKDERNISIMMKARSLTISICMVAAAIVVICLMAAGLVLEASVIAWCVLVYELIYIAACRYFAGKM